MRKIILLLFVMFLGVTNVHAQKHYPITQFADTVEYLKQNFVDQKQHYIGKNFKTLWDVLRTDIEVKFVSAEESRTYDKNIGDGRMWIGGLQLSWMKYKDFCRRFRMNHDAVIALRVEFEYPFTEIEDAIYTDDFDDLTVDFYDKRIPQLLGKQIIKDIELF